MESIEKKFRGVNLIGAQFGRWTVVEFAGRGRKSEALWRVKCECGNERDLGAHILKYGGSLSCGCLRLERITTHGKTHTAEFKIWDGMKQRCHCPTDPGYERYGGRGIFVCQRWRDSFEAFLADMGTRPEGCSIDRIDNDGPYSPDNCRWATPKQQQRNRRANRMFTINGETRCMSEWAEAFGVDYKTLKARIRQGWEINDALNRPMAKRGH